MKSKDATRLDQHAPERVLTALIASPDVYGEGSWEYEIRERSPLINHSRILLVGLETFLADGDTEPLKKAWVRLGHNRRGHRWKGQFRKSCPLFAHTLDRLEKSHD